jgi:branched-chain amino acid transport system ATP-binding protein
MSALLEIEGLTAFYGASQALFGVSLAVNEGEAVALMGRNGMGKTTTIRSLCRMLTQTQGSIRFAGQELSRLPSHKTAQLGIGLVPEGRRCFANLSVMENLTAAARPAHGISSGWRTCFRDWRSGATSAPARYRAANSRCWRSVAP